MKLPTVHLNGTSRDALTSGYADAYHAVSDALDALENVELNGRDYYPQGPDAFSEAQREHTERCVALRVVRDQLCEIVQHLMEDAS